MPDNMHETNFILFVTTLFGLLVGSFLNAIIYRIPRDINIAMPRSKCPSCEKLINWYENIPVISFLLLRGKCSKCTFKIPWRYPFIELITAVIAFLLAPKSLNSIDLFNFFFLFSIASVFIAHFFIDLDFKILPDSLNIYLGILFFTNAILNYSIYHWGLGLLIGAGFPLLVTLAFYYLRGVVGLGGGDIKLYGVLGLYLGPFGVIQNIFLSCFLGSIVGVSLIVTGKMKKDNPIPFGPSIIIVAALQIYFPEIAAKIITII
jgi:prepilin signal peptidase PulO-like enzyme (type II secretory pathway)